MFEYFTGVVCGCNTFFSWNTEIVCGNKHLDSAFKLNDGEKPKGDKNLSSTVRNNKISVEAIRNTFREIEFASAAVTFAAFGNSA